MSIERIVKQTMKQLHEARIINMNNYIKQATLDDNSLAEINVGGTTYKGRDPYYYQTGDGKWVKVQKGVPYVRVD